MRQPITRIRAENFRSLSKVDVELGPLTVLIGANGSGKSNLLKVLQFLATTAKFDLREAVSLWGGFEHVQRQARRTGPVTLEVEGLVTKHATSGAPDNYKLVLSSTATGLRRREEFTFKRTPRQGRRISLTGSRVGIADDDTTGRGESTALASAQTTALATLPKLSDEQGGQGIRDFARLLTQIKLLDPDVDAARSPAPQYGAPLAEDASNLADALHGLSRSSGEAWESLKADLRRCLPGLLDVTFLPVGGAGRAVAAQLSEQGLTAPTDLRDASFGTIRLLALLCALHDPQPAPFLAVEEIDHGLHPYALDLLADRLRSASGRMQIVVATHSPTFVNRLHPDEMVICERDPETGASIIPAIDRAEMPRILEGYEGRAGELWFAGALGGVPSA